MIRAQELHVLVHSILARVAGLELLIKAVGVLARSVLSEDLLAKGCENRK